MDSLFVITKDYLELITQRYQNDILVFTDEAVDYINELFDPIIAKLNRINSLEELNEYALTFPLIMGHFIDNGSLEEIKQIFINISIESLIYEEDGNLGIIDNIDVVTPWIVKSYIYKNKITKKLFDLPPEGDFITMPVTVTINPDNKIIIDLTYEKLLGILAVYHHLSKDHPLSYHDYTFINEMKEINKRAMCNPITCDGYFNVDVGDNTYTFRSFQFFEGLFVAAEWNDLDPHTFITDLKQWKVILNPIGSLKIEPIDIYY